MLVKANTFICLLVFTFLNTEHSFAQMITSTTVTVTDSATEKKYNTEHKKALLLQSIQGRVYDNTTKLPVEDAHIYLLDTLNNKYGVKSSASTGEFEFQRVRLGKYVLRISHVSYRSAEVSVVVNSSNETQAFIYLESNTIPLTSISIEEEFITAPLVSGTNIGPDELERSVGAQFEASRKIASVLPGIQLVDDSRNDFVVRGNSPGSVLWRLEGINIPNPNHFAIPGTSGGPVSMINDRMLGQSSFYSGAFPAMYGNTISALFDYNLRVGNNRDYHHTFQLGVYGAEITSEGPLSDKNKSSYLVNGRLATVGMYQTIGLDIGTNSTPKYGDLSLKLNFPGQKSTWSIFGLTGISSIDILISQDTSNFYGERDRDQFFRTKMALSGVSVNRNLNESSSLSATLAIAGQGIKSLHKLVYSEDIRNEILDFNSGNGSDTLPEILRYNFRENRVSGMIHYNQKLKNLGDRSGNMSLGFNADQYFFNYLDSAVNLNRSNSDYRQWRIRWDTKTSGILFQPFIQFRISRITLKSSDSDSIGFYRKSDFLTGLHWQYFSLNNSFSLPELRMAYRYQFNYNQSINVGIGMHSQMQAPYLYFYGYENDASGKPIPVNWNLGFTQSIHTAVGYQHFIGDFEFPIRIKTEVYYQYIYDVPIDRDSISAFSLLNTGGTYSRYYPYALVNDGKGKNYGIELTVDNSTPQKYQFSLNASLFESTYVGSDGVWRDTDFNGNYTLNAIVSREWMLKRNQNIFSIGGRISTAGGRRHGVADEDQSNLLRELRYVPGTENSLQYKAYFRASIRLNYKINYRKAHHEISVDLTNVTKHNNVLREAFASDFYAWDKGKILKEYQFGFIPFIYYRIDF